MRTFNNGFWFNKISVYECIVKQIHEGNFSRKKLLNLEDFSWQVGSHRTRKYL